MDLTHDQSAGSERFCPMMVCILLEETIFSADLFRVFIEHQDIFISWFLKLNESNFLRQLWQLGKITRLKNSLLFVKSIM